MLKFPWPPRELSPNARIHWAKVMKIKKGYRMSCMLLAKSQGVEKASGAVDLEITFRPPDKRKRDDDNYIAAFKAGRDGLADAMGMDDNDFNVTYKKGPPAKGGCVEVRINGEQK